MTVMPSMEETRREVRRIYAGDPASAGEAVREYLSARLAGLGPEERTAFVERLRDTFTPAGGPAVSDATLMDDFVHLLLGPGASRADAASPETLKRLASSLNTVFDSLNEIIRVMNATLGGGTGEETIRAVIGGGMAAGRNEEPLATYLGQIRTAFFVAHKAFQETARTIVRNVLAEMEPGKIESATGGALKIGPLRKAEAFEIYEATYKKVRKWFESSRFGEEMLREFERNCQRAYSHGEVKS